MDPDELPFRVEERAGAYRVQNRAGSIVLDCADRHSAQHYATLLNQAYQLGYKAGYRAGRAAS